MFCNLFYIDFVHFLPVWLPDLDERGNCGVHSSPQLNILCLQTILSLFKDFDSALKLKR